MDSGSTPDACVIVQHSTKEKDMRTKITMSFLQSIHACSDGLEYWEEKNKPTDMFKLIKQCMKDDHFDYANWLIVRCMDSDQYIRYAIYSAKQELPSFETVYPDDKRVRHAINAARAVLRNNTEETRSAAELAESAVWSAAKSAWLARSAAESADMKHKIINYGMRIMREAARL